ncbi:glycosyltransferase family 2 protein [Cryomorpha ignava]|uniref:dolichyl-phosphate beta-glucosyltransferase n=1 Tax=Cryomorpha ignava TaxID=101383 RepID=A0A7K3WUB9_9FLAO|nr:dolichyl-phosphate beta-glucosyltransferase [Cryomorpha ignava]NEN25269.1 glycosyltransferase family 2 protein [Cryomorpha ignava]
MPAKTGIVIPCYNEAQRIDLASFEAFASANNEYHICFVNDGSTDKTAVVVSAFCQKNPTQFSLLNLDVNKGKGEAVRAGLLALKSRDEFETIGFLDADLATPLEEFKKLNNTLLRGSYQAVFGSRMKKMGSNIDRSVKRHIIGRFFATLISASINLPFYDTQCGAKVFKPDFLNGIIEKPFMTKWLFDVEILIRLKQKVGKEAVYSLVLEMPLDAWTEMGDSKISKADIIRIPIDLLKIRKHYK